MTLATNLKESKTENREVREVSLAEAANMLSVSTATIRNWIRSGKFNTVNRQGRSAVIDREEVLTLKHKIESGSSRRLKSRRNKRAVRGNYIPSEYVDSEEYLKLAEEIVNLVNDSGQEIQPNLVLFEVALSLLKDKGHLNLSPQDLSEVSLTELVIENKLDLGGYETILRQLFDFEEQVIVEEDYALLRSIHSLKINYLEGEDLLGLLYMSLSNLGVRKSSGSYYTPSKLVDMLVEKNMAILTGIKFPRIVDPCCGSGNFLLKLFIALRSKLLRESLSLEEVERRLREECLFGFDLDKIAVTLAKINIALVSDTKLRNRSVNFKIECGDSLEGFGTGSSTDVGGYDLVIGNPPWGYSFPPEAVQSLKERFVSAQASLESFCLFLEYGVSILKEGGILSYVLPESLLNVQMHMATRELLLKGTQILNITLLGHQFSKVFSPTITLTVRKGASSPDQIIVVESIEERKEIPQKRFLNNDLFIFNVLASNKEEEIIEQMTTLPGVKYLKDNADFALGIVTGNNKRYVLDKVCPGAEPVLKGNDVFKYNFYPGGNYLIFEQNKFQQVAPEHLYRAPEKLIYRFINENLIFAYDDGQTLSLNSANIIIPRLKGYAIKYILAVLNSRPVQYFHTLSFSSVKVLRKHLESIPIPPCPQIRQGQIVDLVDRIIKAEDSSIRLKLYDQIDQHILDLYQLTEEQKTLIYKRFGTVKFISR